MTAATPFDLDRATNTLTFRRTIAATAERLFEAWTTPAQVARWWDPDGRPLEACEIDLCVGGGFRYVNAGHLQRPFEGRYTRIEPPGLLQFEAMGATGTVHFEPDGAQTRMTVSIRCASPEHLEQFVALGVGEGTARTLDNLAAFLDARVMPAG